MIKYKKYEYLIGNKVKYSPLTISLWLQARDKFSLLSIRAPGYWKWMHLTINTTEHSNNYVWAISNTFANLCSYNGFHWFDFLLTYSWLWISLRIWNFFLFFYCKNVIADDPRKNKQQKMPRPHFLRLLLNWKEDQCCSNTTEIENFSIKTKSGSRF